jgi:predicted CoA-substrate-specific enzyme activase
MKSLGINIGSTSLKMVITEGSSISWKGTLSHDGDIPSALENLIHQAPIEPGMPALVTGNEGRFLFKLPGILEPLSTEAALKAAEIQAHGVVSMGGEDLVVYTLNDQGTIQNNFSGSKCASGTGEFFKQQLSRMNMTLKDVAQVDPQAKVMPISTRCSVFMKSDCTHRLNKREATKDDIVLSLSQVMAVKVTDFLKRAKISQGRVVLTGGLTLNPHIMAFIREKAPEIECIIPPGAEVFEAYGAAILAQTNGVPLPTFQNLLKPMEVKFDTLPSLRSAEDLVTYFDAKEAPIKPGRSYILGVDGGSTTTKACLIDQETLEVVASHYGRTHGDPVKALKECLSIIQDKITQDLALSPTSAQGQASIQIQYAAVTGSSRELLGVFLETQGVYNEIIAHAVGTTFFDPEAETIFEIGGQDAKYVLIKNGVPIDYAMNEACSAGTGSFLEESASGDLSIGQAKDIGPVALRANAPLKFGEHCSAFINSDIRKAIQQGATKENITAGIVVSIVANYLNRVVGNRTIGNKIFLQGGVAKNPAVPLAFALMLQKQILVPPSPELTGCFGAALMAKEKAQQGLLNQGEFDLEELLTREIGYEKVFTCKSCDNYCPIQILDVHGKKYMFGGRCNKYTNTRKTQLQPTKPQNQLIDHPTDQPTNQPENQQLTNQPEGKILDYVEERQKLLFHTCAANPTPTQTQRDFTIGIPRAFSVHSLYPLYSWFFHQLGIKTILSDDVAREGVARVESTYCFPAEIAHGAVQDCINKGADYILLPHFRDMPSYEEDVHANFCPITQGLPYYITKAFPDVDQSRFLPLVVSFKFGELKALEHFKTFGRILNLPDHEVEDAFWIALDKQREFYKKAKELGQRALEEARKATRPVIAILGRPYNGFTSEANMGIPRKFTTRGYSVIPFDILPYESEKIFPNMYWYYGQQDMKVASFLKEEDNIFLTFITNFSCAPDSFMLHYIKWTMGQKPFLVLELDSHTADAGIDTRVEAFLDIIDGYRTKKEALEQERYDNGWSLINDGTGDLQVHNTKTGAKESIRGNPRIKVLLSNMGNISTEFLAATLRGVGLNAHALPLATNKTVQLARAHASGKECVPSHLVLGSALEFFASDKYRKDELYLLFVPITTGPCRTGQYFVYYQNLFRDLQFENVVVFTLSADNSYTELGPNFAKDMWRGLVVSDYMKDIQTSLKALALDPTQALRSFEESWHRMITAVETQPKNLWKELKRVKDLVKTIPLKRPLADAPRVLVVGEIYVRRDDFAVGELIDLLSARGIVVKVSGIGEWIHYLDFVRTFNLKKQLGLHSPLTRWFSKPVRTLVKLKLEQAWKHRVEHRVKAILGPTGLLAPAPHDMNAIMDNTQKHFVSHELNSEIAVSTGAAATAMDLGYSGIVNIAPFACLIGRVIEGIYTPWARDRNYPALSVEVDGNQLPPNIINKLNIFMVNVLRHRGSGDVAQMVEEISQEITSLSDPCGDYSDCGHCGSSASPCGTCSSGSGGIGNGCVDWDD